MVNFVVNRINSNASKAAARRVADEHGGFIAASKSGVRKGDVTVVTVPKQPKDGSAKQSSETVKVQG